jgi:hypothetical protein
MAHFPPDIDSDRDGNPAILGEFLGSSADMNGDLHDAAIEIAAVDSDWTSSDEHSAVITTADSDDAPHEDGDSPTASRAEDSFTLASADPIAAYDGPLSPDPLDANHTALGSGSYWMPYTAPDVAGTPPDTLAPNTTDTGFPTAAGNAEPVWAPAFADAAPATHSNTAPVVSINHPFSPTGEWSNVGTWVDYADADGNPATLYQFRDSNPAANSAYLSTPDNAHWAANTDVTVAAANLDDVRVHSGGANTSDIMWVRAFDGTDWSNWAEIDFMTTAQNFSSGIVVTLANTVGYYGADTLSSGSISADTLSSGTITMTTGTISLTTGAMIPGEISGHPPVIIIDLDHLLVGSASHAANSLLI